MNRPKTLTDGCLLLLFVFLFSGTAYADLTEMPDADLGTVVGQSGVGGLPVLWLADTDDDEAMASISGPFSVLSSILTSDVSGEIRMVTGVVSASGGYSQMRMTVDIDSVSFENIRPAGSLSESAAFGSLFIENMHLEMNGQIRIQTGY